MRTLLLPLGVEDYKTNLGGWACEALSIPFANLEKSEVLDAGGRIVQRSWVELSPEFGGGLVKWTGPGDQSRPKNITLHLKFDEKKAGKAVGAGGREPWYLALIPLFTAGGFFANLVSSEPQDCEKKVVCAEMVNDWETEKARAERLEGSVGALSELLKTCKDSSGNNFCSSKGEGGADCKNIKIEGFKP